MLAILKMNASDQILQGRTVEHYTATGPLLFSSLLTPALQHFDTSTLILIERAAWWFHIVGILGFAVYITYSKHLHIFLAFPNTYFANLEPKGHMENMPVVTHEVKMTLGLGEATPQPPQPPEDLVPKISMICLGIICWLRIRVPNAGDAHRNARLTSPGKNFRREKL
jgi:hypothetical protein